MAFSLSGGVQGTRGLVYKSPVTKPKFSFIVSYFDGNVYCYINGKLNHVSNSVQGGFSNWERYSLLFGDEASGGRNWEGKLSRVAIYSRFVGVEEAAHKFKLIQEE